VYKLCIALWFFKNNSSSADQNLTIIFEKSPIILCQAMMIFVKRKLYHNFNFKSMKTSNFILSMAFAAIACLPMSSCKKEPLPQTSNSTQNVDMKNTGITQNSAESGSNFNPKTGYTKMEATARMKIIKDRPPKPPKYQYVEPINNSGTSQK
jgi:hypothetical protein